MFLTCVTSFSSRLSSCFFSIAQHYLRANLHDGLGFNHRNLDPCNDAKAHLIGSPVVPWDHLLEYTVPKASSSCKKLASVSCALLLLLLLGGLIDGR